MKSINKNRNNWILWVLALLVILFGAISLSQHVKEKTHPEMVVEWATANEIDTVGYNILRSETPDGVLVQVNSSIVPASSDPFAGGEYQFIDQSTKPGTAYYYWLESIGTNGISEKHGPLEVKSGSASVFEFVSSILSIIFGLGLIMYKIINHRKRNLKFVQYSS